MYMMMVQDSLVSDFVKNGKLNKKKSCPLFETDVKKLFV